MFSRILTSSTVAFIAALSIAYNAEATIPKDDPTIKVTTGGFFKFMAGVVHNHHEFKDKYIYPNGLNSGVRNRKHDFFMDAEVIIKADGSTKDGFKYGAEVQLESNPGNSQKADKKFIIDGKEHIITIQDNPGSAHLINADKVYMHASMNDYGRVEAGSVEGVADELFYFAPASFGTGGIDGNYQDFLGSEIIDTAYKPKNSFRSLKLTYITPRYDGFQAGVSYAPAMNRRGRLIKRNRVALTDPGTSPLAPENFEHVSEYGINYVNTFDGFGVFLSVTGTHGLPLKYPNRAYKELNAFGIGANFAYAGFTLGGSYVNNTRSGYFKGLTHIPSFHRVSFRKERAWSIGLQYETGPVIIGTNYVNMKTAGNTTVLGRDSSDVVSGGATYKLASGLSLFGEATGVHRKLKRKNDRHDRDHRSLYLLGTKVVW